MDETTIKINKEASHNQTIMNFIKNPLDRTINPRHIMSYAIDKKRAKSLLRKVDKAFQYDRNPQNGKHAVGITLSFDEIITEMKKLGYVDKKLKKLLLDNIYANPLVSNEQRKELWFLASGAKLKKNMYRSDYYSKMKNDFTNYPDFFQNMIEKDLNRTFHENRFNPDEQMIDKMRAVLNCYSKRNPTIGYCQGLNFIVARIIEVIEDEENSFWILCALLEDVLPIDYFSSMVGVLIDQKIFSEMVYRHDKILARKLFELEVDPSLFSLQWFVCCYVSTFQPNLCNVIWDLLFVEGSNILFKAGLTYLSSIKDRILEFTEFNQIFVLLDESPKIDYEPKDLLKKINHIYISKKLLGMLRHQYQWIIEQDLQNVENKRRHRASIINFKEMTACKPEWPVCIDVLEKCRQKKRNSSIFALSVRHVHGSKENYLTEEGEKRTFNRFSVRKRSTKKSTPKGKEKVRGRGRERDTFSNISQAQIQYLMQGLEKLEGAKEDKPEDKHKNQPREKSEEKEIEKEKNLEKEEAAEIEKIDENMDERKLSEDSNGGFKAEKNDSLSPSERQRGNNASKPSRGREVHRNLVIGRHEHICKEYFVLKANKSLKSPTKKHGHTIDFNSKHENVSPAVRKTMIGKPLSRLRSEGKFPFASRKPSAFNPEEERAAKPGLIEGFIKTLFGGNPFKRTTTEYVGDTIPDFVTRRMTMGKSAQIRREENPIREVNRDTDEDENMKTGPRKTIYNYLVDPELAEGGSSLNKSVLFMQEFFKDQE